MPPDNSLSMQVRCGATADRCIVSARQDRPLAAASVGVEVFCSKIGRIATGGPQLILYFGLEKTVRAAAWGRWRPATRAGPLRACPPQAAARVVILNLRLNGRRGPQPLFIGRYFAQRSVAMRPAARSRPRAEGCSSKVAGPSARLRACPRIGIGPSGPSGPQSLVLYMRPRRGRRTAAWGRRRPAVRCRICVLCRLRPELEYMPKRAQKALLILNFEY